jgi:hypothetical protein
VNYEFERILKGRERGELSRHLPGGTEEKRKNRQDIRLWGARVQAWISQIRSRSVNYSATTFVIVLAAS